MSSRASSTRPSLTRTYIETSPSTLASLLACRVRSPRWVMRGPRRDTPAAWPSSVRVIAPPGARCRQQACHGPGDQRLYPGYPNASGFPHPPPRYCFLDIPGPPAVALIEGVRAMPGITVGVDGSQHAQPALDWAVKEAGLRRAPPTVLTVHEGASNHWTGHAITVPADETDRD